MGIHFKTREEAGKHLAESFIQNHLGTQNPIVYGVPRGGIPVAYPLAERLKAPLEAVVLRKLPIPKNPEAGFGAVTLDKRVILNKAMLTHLNLSKAEIDEIVDQVHQEVLRRQEAYDQSKTPPKLKGRTAIVVDDGLASGFTMLAAVTYLKAQNPDHVYVAVPVAHEQAFNKVSAETDEVICLYVSEHHPFAVASFYDAFPEMTDDEVKDYLNKRKGQ